MAGSGKWYRSETIRMNSEKDLEKQPLLGNNNNISKIEKEGTESRQCRIRKLSVLCACVMTQVITIGIGYGMSVMYAEIVSVTGAPRSEVALIQGIYFGIAGGAGIIFISLIKKQGPGVSIVVGSVVSGIGFIGCYLTNDVLTVIILAGGISGTGACICYLSGFVAVGWTFQENTGVYLIIITLGSAIGQFVMPLVFQACITAYSWNGTFIMLAAFQLQCIAFGVYVYSCRDLFVTGNDEQQRSAEKKTRLCDWSLMTDVLLWIILLACFTNSATGNTESFFMVDIMVSRGFSMTTGSTLASVNGLANFFGRLAGVMVRYLFSRMMTLYHWIYLSVILATCHILIINVLAYWPTLVVVIVYGLAFGMLCSQPSAIMLEVVGLERYPYAMGMMNFTQGCGNLVSGLLGGYIRDTLGQYSVMFYISAGGSVYIATTSAIAAYFLRKRLLRNPELELLITEE